MIIHRPRLNSVIQLFLQPDAQISTGNYQNLIKKHFNDLIPNEITDKIRLHFCACLLNIRQNQIRIEPL